MGLSILGSRSEETRQVVEENVVQALLGHQQDSRATIREDQAQIYEEQVVRPQEEQSRSRAVSSSEQFPQDNVRVRQQRWATGPCAGTFRISSRRGSKVFDGILKGEESQQTVLVFEGQMIVPFGKEGCLSRGGSISSIYSCRPQTLTSNYNPPANR